MKIKIHRTGGHWLWHSVDSRGRLAGGICRTCAQASAAAIAHMGAT